MSENVDAKPENKITPVNSYVDSVQTIMEHCVNFHDDLKDVEKLDFESWYEIVCQMPYAEDEEQRFCDPEISIESGENYELNWRPKYILEKLSAADCKKKSILIGAFCIHNGIPVRFVVMSNQPNKQPHHIFTEIKESSDSGWIPADATYENNRLGTSEPETYREVFEYEYSC